jgi:hypothetical protein
LRIVTHGLDISSCSMFLRGEPVETKQMASFFRGSPLYRTTYKNNSVLMASICAMRGLKKSKGHLCNERLHLFVDVGYPVLRLEKHARGPCESTIFLPSHKIYPRFTKI